MEINDEGDKYKIISENLHIILKNELEKFTKCIEVIEEMKSDKSLKFENLANKIENSLQQLQLIEHELESCKSHLESISLKINEKTISEITKIKNPNETITEIVKLFFIITGLIDENEIINWNYLQSKSVDYDLLRKNLFEIQTKNINKETIDNCMNITFNYNDLKFSMSKISKNLVIIIDLLKIIVDFSIKKNMKESLQQTNINKTQKLNFIKSQIEDLKDKFNKAINYLNKMKKEYETLLNVDSDIELRQAIIYKYDLLEKYKIFLDENEISKLSSNLIKKNSESDKNNNFLELHTEDPIKNEKIHNEESYYSSTDNNVNKTKLTIKLKSKYQNDNNFFFSILKANGENINNKDFTQNYSKSDINSTVSDKKYEIAKNLEKIQIVNTNSRSRNNRFDLFGGNKQNIEKHQTLNNILHDNKNLSVNDSSHNNNIKFRSINVNINENHISNVYEHNKLHYNDKVNSDCNVDKNLHVNLNLNLHSYVHPHHNTLNYMDNSKNFSLNEFNNNLKKAQINSTYGINNLNYFHTDNNLKPNQINIPTNNQIDKIFTNKNGGNNSNNNIPNRNSMIHNTNMSKNSYNKPQEISNFSNRYSNEIQIRSNLQIQELSKNNSLYKSNINFEKVKNLQNIQKIRINNDNPKTRDNFQGDQLIDNVITNKAFFKSTNDDLFSSELKEVLTKDPSLKSNTCKGQYNDNKMLETNHIILENKFNEYNNEEVLNFKLANKKFNNQFENCPVLIVNEYEKKNANENNIEHTSDKNRVKHSSKKINNKSKIILEKSNNTSTNDCYKQLCCMK